MTGGCGAFVEPGRRVAGRAHLGRLTGSRWAYRADSLAENDSLLGGVSRERTYDVRTSPARSARAAACTRVETPSLRKMLLT